MKKIVAINGLRGIAIMGVIYQHLFWQYTSPGWVSVSLFGYKVFPLTYLSNGWMGVNLFFILSGFVLFLPFASRERHIESKRDFFSFYKHRAARLLPLYYISIFFLIFFVSDVKRDETWAFIKHIFFMTTATFCFTKDMWGNYNPVLWSIGIEIWFSILFPFLVIAAKKIGIRKLFIATLVISLIVRFAGVSSQFGSPYQNVLKDSLFGRLDDFVLGMVICWTYLNNKASRNNYDTHIYFGAGLFLITIGCMLWDYKVLGVLPKFVIPLLNNILQGGFALIIMSLLWAVREDKLSLIFTNRPLQVIGMMSYSLYMWHYPPLQTVIGNHITPFNTIIYLVFLLVFSSMTYRYIEFGKKDAKELFLLKQ